MRHLRGSIRGGNSIPKEGTRGANPKINVKQFLGILVLCTEYTDQSGNQYSGASFYQFPNLNPQLTKEQGGGGLYESSDIPPTIQSKLEKLSVCKGLTSK
jgi:hypothetical protein